MNDQSIISEVMKGNEGNYNCKNILDAIGEDQLKEWEASKFKPLRQAVTFEIKNKFKVVVTKQPGSYTDYRVAIFERTNNNTQFIKLGYAYKKLDSLTEFINKHKDGKGQ